MLEGDMKYRLVELLRCPEHPNTMLRVTGARLSEVFPYSGELSQPVCRSGCGWLGNWFTDIPETLPPHHRFDCRRCMDTEIETAELRCPECGWSLKVVDGVLQGCGSDTCSFEPDVPFNRRAGMLIDKQIALQPGELALVLAPLPGAMLERWSGRGIERLQVELSSEVMLSGRARSCANGQGLVHYLGGPVDLSILRPREFDALILPVPSTRLAGYPEALALIPPLLRQSGRAVLAFGHDSHGSPRMSPEAVREELPDSFDDLDVTVHRSPGVDLVFARRPEPENGNELMKEILNGRAKRS